jgi:hypothetical protein
MDAALVSTKPPRRSRVLGQIFLTGMFLFGLCGVSHAQSFEEVRAIFLFNFAKNVTWPDATFSDGQDPVRIGIVGNPRVAKALERAVKGKDANGREVKVVTLDSSLGCDNMHMVYIGDEKLTTEVLGAIAGKPILTVSDGDAFIDQGGLIRLVTKGKSVGCMINASASSDAGLVLSDKLVRAGGS